MDSFLIFLEFILNNLFKVSVILIGTVLAVYFLQKVYREMRLNRKLRSFQRTLRLMPKNQRRKRIFTLGSMVIIPLLMVIIFFQITRNPQIDYEHHITRVESSSDVQMIHDNYQQKFSMLISLRPTTYDFSSDYSDDAELTISTNELLPTTQTDDQYMYIFNHNQLTIFDTTNEINPIYKTIETVFNQIPYYSPAGMFVDDKYLVVVLNVYDMRIQNGNFTESDQNTETHVYVFDKHDDFKLENNYVIDGAIKDVNKNNQRLMLVTEHAIPFSKEDLNVDNYLPTYFINGVATKSLYEDVRYIQGTNPKVFLTTSTLNLETNHIDQEILLTDDQHHIYMTQNAVYFSILSHEFVETSETFVLSEPVEKTYTSLTQINFERDVVRYHTTSMLEGKIADASSIYEYNNQLCIGTVEKNNSIYKNRLYILDDSLQVLTKMSVNNEENSMMESIRFINHHAYIAYQDSSLPLAIIDLDHLDVESFETIEFSSYLHKINNNYALGIGYNDNGNDGIVDSVNIILYNINDLDSIYIEDAEIISFSDYGLTVSDALMNKTMVYNSEQNILMYPINMFTRINNFTQQGVLLFDVDFTDGIEYKTFLTHENDIVSFNNYRSVFHGDYLYTISNDYVSVSHVDDIDTVLNVYELN